MIESNDPLKLKQEAQARARRRKSAGWKSGLMLTGLGAVVAGAGYLAGVNAPSVAQSASQTIATNPSNGAGDPALTSGANANDGQGLLSNGDDGQGILGSGAFQFRGDEDSGRQFNQQFGDDGSSGSGQLNQNGQLNRQFGGRRSRQLPGFSQQQPNFSRPLTRSRGS